MKFSPYYYKGKLRNTHQKNLVTIGNFKIIAIGGICKVPVNIYSVYEGQITKPWTKLAVTERNGSLCLMVSWTTTIVMCC
jgi:hypothetical protein